jgi:hypothetical protein
MENGSRPVAQKPRKADWTAPENTSSESMTAYTDGIPRATVKAPKATPDGI